LSRSLETEEDFCLNSSLSSNFEDQSVLASDDLQAASPSFSSVLEMTNLTSESDSFSFKPLYEGVNITLCGAMCAIIKYSTTNKLTYKAISDLLQLLDLLLSTQNLLPKSFFKFITFFQQFSPNCAQIVARLIVLQNLVVAMLLM